MSIDEVYRFCASPCSFVWEREIAWKAALRPKNPNSTTWPFRFCFCADKSKIHYPIGVSGNCHVPTASGGSPHRHCRLAHTTRSKVLRRVSLSVTELHAQTRPFITCAQGTKSTDLGPSFFFPDVFPLLLHL